MIRLYAAEIEQLAGYAAGYGVLLSPGQQEQLRVYLTLLVDWNARLNLTAIREPQHMVVRHFLDALTCAQVVTAENGRSLIDVGTGAGFPGLPLKILYPDLRLTLVDSVAKKTRFLEAVTAELGLPQVTILAQRAEVLGQQAAHRQQYDWAVGRAVAELRVLVEYLLPFCRVGGCALAQKGESVTVELAAALPAIAQLGGGTPAVSVVQLPAYERSHYLVVIPKTGQTPPELPRRPGLAAKRPL